MILEFFCSREGGCIVDFFVLNNSAVLGASSVVAIEELSSSEKLAASKAAAADSCAALVLDLRSIIADWRLVDDVVEVVVVAVEAVVAAEDEVK